MTMARRESLIFFKCDGPRCYKSFCTDTKEFYKAVGMLKAEVPKWRIAKHNNGEYHHFCPSCREWSYQDADYSS